MTFASVGDVRVALVSGVAMTRKAFVLLPAKTILALANAASYVPGALPRRVAGQRCEALLNCPP